MGFGTWAFGAGKVPVGIDSSDTDFDTAEETGGAKTHTLTKVKYHPHQHLLFKNVGVDIAHLLQVFQQQLFMLMARKVML